jgi:hypothetical protein
MRIAIILAAALIATSAHAAGFKTVKDWTAVCDNVGDCTAFGFSEEAADMEAYLEVVRHAGPTAAPKLLLVYDAPDKQPSQTWTVTLDGHPIAGLGPIHATGGEDGARGVVPASLIAALRNGQSLEINQAGKELASISLVGSAAALLWVDDQQGRVGTVTALAKPGPKPASDVPPPKPAPLIAVAPAASQAGLPKHAPKSLIEGIDECDIDPTMKDTDDIVARLAPGLVLWGPQCEMAAYNELNIFYVGDEHGGHVRRLTFPEPAGLTPSTDDELMNVTFDPKTQTLASFSKGRGIGDCGSDARWVWDGKAFQLLSEAFMSECRGVLAADWPPIFVARRR